MAIRRRLASQPTRRFRYQDRGDVAVIGRLAGVTNIPWLGPFGRQGGFIAWLLWLGIHIFYLIGFANRIVHEPPAGVTVAVPDPTTIVVSGADRQAVGQFAANIRASKKPEPYKGKGIRYDNEVVRRKEGKSFAAGGK